MLILIRCDASAAIGLGHLRRCLSLAVALRAAGAGVRFALRRRDLDAVAIAEAEGFAAKLLPMADGATAEDDADAFAGLWPGEPVAAVVVDHYQLDARWHGRVRRQLGCLVAVVDDLADRTLDADLLIDHNFVPAPGHRARYAACLQRSPGAWLCGPRFALLGPAYAAAAEFEVADTVRSIGIFLGGTDPAGLSAGVLQACRRDAGFTGPIEVVSTRGNPGLDALRAAVAVDPQARLSLDLPDLAAFNARHDLQIGAGGGATWERCCIGVPALTLCVADNQRAVIPALAALGALVTTPDNQPSSIGAALRPLLGSRAQRLALSRAAQALVDGRGAERVALALLLRAGARLALRAATTDDAQRLWQWRNHPATRSVSRQAEPIPWPDHLQWLQRTLADPSRRLWLAQLGDRPVGVIRFDALSDARHEVSLYLDPGLHGLGLGSALLAAGEAALAAAEPDGAGNGPITVLAEVLPDNPASRQLFVAAGYRAASSASAASEHAFAKTLAAPAIPPARTPECSR